jgi:hypothetical protein
MLPPPFYGRAAGRNDISLLTLRHAKRNYWTDCE